MAIATTTAIALALAAAAAGTSYYNTEKTASRQDQAAADAIRNQSRIQKEGDTKVNDTVAKLAASTAAAGKEQRLDDYLGVLRRNKDTTTAGLSPAIGGDAFKADAATAANDAQGFAQKTAGLMSRMDAPQIQRQGEAFDYGNLATDLGLVGRESKGQAFLDQLRQSRIRRNAKLDLAAGLMSAAAGGVAGGASSAGSGMSGAVNSGAGIEGAGNYMDYAGYA